MTQPSPSAESDRRYADTDLLLRIGLSREQDLVLARQRARHIAELIGYEAQDQVRVATAVSEIAREGLQHGPRSAINFRIDRTTPALLVELELRPSGVSIATTAEAVQRAEGIVMARRFLGIFAIETDLHSIILSFRKPMPASPGREAPAIMTELTKAIGRTQPKNLDEEFRAQNRELLETLTELRHQQNELTKLNRELEETNRGVVALYSELEDQAEALRRAGEQKVRFYSSISHEFRTPITSILSLSQILLDRLDGPLGDEQEKQVTLIRKCGQNLLEWVNDLLDLARVDAGRMQVRVSTFAVRDLLASLRGIMRPLVMNSGIQLTIAEESVDPSLVMTTDEGLISQILRNLVGNALKFTEHGEVRVEVDGRSCPTGQVVFTVRDTGIGIALEDQERVFEEFIQIDGPLQRKRKGTGLGLPLCRRLAGLLGGSVSLTSSVGVGSTFFVEIPCQIQSPDQPYKESGRSARPQETGGMKPTQLLLIDDDDAWRYLARQALSKLGVEVLEASNGADGLELAKEHHPSAIILDLLMPHTTGYDVLNALQELPDTREIPVIVWTSEDIDASADARLIGRIHSLIRKPTDGQGPALGEIAEALRSAGALNQEAAS